MLSLTFICVNCNQSARVRSLKFHWSIKHFFFFPQLVPLLVSSSSYTNSSGQFGKNHSYASRTSETIKEMLLREHNQNNRGPLAEKQELTRASHKTVLSKGNR
ncbi:unnamed protein product [Ixodes persulcatus]